MGDYYTEQLVKKKPKATDGLIKVGMGIVTILSIFLIFIIPYAIVITAVLIFADILLLRRLNVEYEYLYVNGDLDIDKIMSKSKRKKVFEMNIKDMEILAPSGSSEMRLYQNIKANNYSSGEEGASAYELIAYKKGEKIKIIFEPNQAILDGMRMLAPRKIIL
ncbi:MAG: DUF6106 family protein [Lachnospiraceae bacterium]|nr:DUF6106 family protein [Lachnospiraceae bacterium]